MSLLQLHHTAFSAGVLSPAFWGRSDIDNFDRALATAKNFYIDYRGGVKNRPGTRFVASNPDGDLRFYTFAMGNYTDDFLLVFTDLSMSVIKAGEFVVHGTLPLSTPWNNSDLDGLRFAQKDLVLTVTHQDHPPREIKYNPQTEAWTLEVINFSVPKDRPQVDSVLTTAVGAARLVVAVTAVDKNGQESLPSRPFLIKDVVDFTTSAGALRYRATKVAGARSYRWYRSVISSAADVAIAQNLGYIGESQGRTFTDRNTIPDFSRPPPVSLNPFAGGQVLGLEIGSEGSGYTSPNTIAVTKSSGPGSGLIAYPSVIDEKVESVVVLNWGQDYTMASTFAISGGGGSGATVSLEAVSPEKSFPKLCAYFQQRRLFASTEQIPVGIWGSRIAAYDDFGFRPLPRDDEGYAIYADIPGNDFIEHMLPVGDSILIFHSYGVDRLSGGERRAVTPNSHILEPQTSAGSGNMHPILVDKAVVYSSPRGESLNTLNINNNAGGFVPADLSSFVRHYFTPDQKPKQVVWQQEPDRILWILTTNGKLLSLTYVPAQETYAWAEHETSGQILDIMCVREQSRDVVYLFVTRFIGGVQKWFIEEMADRRVNHVEQSWFLDAALATNITAPASSLRIKFNYDNIGEVLSTFTATTPAAYFNSSLHVGWHLRTMNGLYKILSVDSATQVSGVIIDYPGNEERYDEDGWYYRAQGEWWLDQPRTLFSGLGHLANQKVNVLADGNVYKDVQVDGSGEITLPQPHTRVVAGLPYQALIKSLPLSSREVLIEGRKKRIVGVKIRFNNSRGLEAGSRRMYAMRDTSFHEREENLQLRSGIAEISIDDTWKIDNHLTVVQNNPLPADILGYVLEIEA